MGQGRSPIAGRHLVRYGIAADQRYLVEDFLGTYDQLVINANIIAHMPGAIASFLLQRARGKPYFVDPQTHAFQHDVSNLMSSSEQREGKIKRSIRRLIEAYGEPISTVIERRGRSVRPTDFSDSEERRDFCQRVIRFQAEAIRAQVKKSDSAKYLAFLEEKGLADLSQRPPTLLVAPYFCLTSDTLGGWLDVNLRCARDCVDVASRSGIPLAAQIVISRDLLTDEKGRAKLAAAYAALDLSVLLLWVESFPEDEASQRELSCYVDLVRVLGGRGTSVVNLYGGYLSVALSVTVSLPALAGVTHGLEYGEDRPVTPVGGGFPHAKFYLPAIHTRLLFRQALRGVTALGGVASPGDFHKHVCGCRECRQVISKDPQNDFFAYGETYIPKGDREVPTPETKAHCVRHYMWAKKREYSTGQDARVIASQLEAAAKRLEPALGQEAVAHCRRWAAILRRPPLKT